jgi:hypothetical protein
MFRIMAAIVEVSQFVGIEVKRIRVAAFALRRKRLAGLSG